MPLPLRRSWVEHVNRPQIKTELATIRRCVLHEQPFGGDRWADKAAKQMGLEHTFRPRGRFQNTNVVDLEPMCLTFQVLAPHDRDGDLCRENLIGQSLLGTQPCWR